MSSFHFRLETLLRIRLAERDQRRSDLAQALRAEQLLRQQERQLRGEQQELAETARNLKAPGTARVDAMLETHRYERVLAGQMRQLAERIGQVAAETERRRMALVEADRQVRVLEKLREGQAALHLQGQQRVEARQFDEQATLGHIRKAEAPA